MQLLHQHLARRQKQNTRMQLKNSFFEKKYFEEKQIIRFKYILALTPPVMLWK